MRFFRPHRLALCAATLVTTAALAIHGCSHHAVVDTMVLSAHRPDPVLAVPGQKRGGDAAAARYQLLAGDLHCHVSPPDDPRHVPRGLAETVTLAREESLDFVVLTPHVPAAFFREETVRRRTLRSQEALQKAIDAAPVGDIVFVAGMEYTDHRFGHVGVAFGDLGRTLAEAPLAEMQRRPGLFFERYVARGGLLVVNHPLATPLDAPISIARADLSWRPFTAAGPFPAEIATVDRIAHGLEAYNLTVTHLRDRWLLGDTERSLRGTLRLLDDRVAAGPRRIAAVGGSDSHSGHLRATTFVLAEARTASSIRDAIVAGRTCVRDPAACSLEARPEGGSWRTVGESIDGAASVEARARGDSIDLFVGGEVVAHPADGESVRVTVPAGRCTTLRARVDDGFSSPIYLGCGL